MSSPHIATTVATNITALHANCYQFFTVFPSFSSVDSTELSLMNMSITTVLQLVSVNIFSSKYLLDKAHALVAILIVLNSRKLS